VDAPFDADGDGYFDATNPDCADTYAADQLDCDDGDGERSQEHEESCDDGIAAPERADPRRGRRPPPH